LSVRSNLQSTIGNRKSLKRLKVFAGFKAHRFSGRNVDLSAGAWISSDARLARLDVEDSKPAQFDAIAFGERLLHGLEDGLDRDLGFGLCDTGPIYDLADDIELYHANLLKTNILILDIGFLVVKPFLL
jgi:hypothetical protein